MTNFGRIKDSNGTSTQLEKRQDDRFPRHGKMINRRSALLITSGLIIAIMANTLAYSNDQVPIQEFDRCKAIVDAALRLRCLEKLVSPPLEAGTPAPKDWRLIRTSDPGGGPDVVSIVRVADLSRSSPEIAGLMIRCRRAAAREVLIALVKPLPPHARPNVRLTAGAVESTLSGSVVPPGSAILLPIPAEIWAKALGPDPIDLTINIDTVEMSAHGVVPISDLDAALLNLTLNCRQP